MTEPKTAPVLDMQQARMRFIARNTAKAVEQTRSRAEYVAKRLLKAAGRRGTVTMPKTALELMDMIDDLAECRNQLHCQIDDKDLQCLKSWHATKRLMLQVKEAQTEPA